MIKADNATGNFVKVAQRVAVRIAIDPGSAAPGRAAGCVRQCRWRRGSSNASAGGGRGMTPPRGLAYRTLLGVLASCAAAAMGERPPEAAGDSAAGLARTTAPAAVELAWWRWLRRCGAECAGRTGRTACNKTVAVAAARVAKRAQLGVARAAPVAVARPERVGRACPPPQFVRHASGE